jgi:transposase
MYFGAMKDRKAALFRLYPTPEQASQMAQIVGACRFIYNLALEQRQTWYRPERKFGFASQCRKLTLLRAEMEWLKAASIPPLQQALRDLDRTYHSWRAKQAGAPTPRKKGMNDSFRSPDPVSLRLERSGTSSGRLKLPKLGWVTLRGWQKPPGAISYITASRLAGQWFAAVQCAREVSEPVVSTSWAWKAHLAISRPIVLTSFMDVSLRCCFDDSPWHIGAVRWRAPHQGWSLFRTLLGDKLANPRGRLMEVPAAYTSQSCSTCSLVEATSRQGQARFVCVGCGHAANADSNAAVNILRHADSALKPVAGNRCKRPGEAGTTSRNAA